MSDEKEPSDVPPVYIIPVPTPVPAYPLKDETPTYPKTTPPPRPVPVPVPVPVPPVSGRQYQEYGTAYNPSYKLIKFIVMGFSVRFLRSRPP